MDLWSVDQTKAAFLGITAHWIDSGKESCSSNWTLHTEVITFRGISGMHTGENIGRYFVSLAERVGIITPSAKQPFLATDTTAISPICKSVQPGQIP